MSLQNLDTQFDQLPPQEKKKIAALAAIERERRLVEERMRYFKPNNEDQEKVWELLADPKLRILVVTGGNRSGKTEITTQAAAKLLYGEGPLATRGWKPPIMIRQCSPDFERGVKGTLIPKWKSIIRRDGLFGKTWVNAYKIGERRFHLSDQSFVEWMTYSQDAELHQAAQRHIILFDEWPTEDIYKESRMRVIDFAGLLIIAATPTAGTAEAWQMKLVNDIERGEIKNAAVVHLITTKNKALPKDFVDDLMEDLTDDEKAMVIYGQFVSRGGAVIPELNRKYHYIPHFVPPPHWPTCVNLDVHSNKPNHGNFSAINIDKPEPEFHTWGEFICGDTIAKTCEYLAFAAEGRKIDEFFFERSAKNYDHNTGVSEVKEFRKYYPFRKWSKDAEGGRRLIRKYARVDEVHHKTRFFVHDNCPITMEQLEHWSYKDPAPRGDRKPEEVRKIDDHMCDCVRSGIQWFDSHALSQVNKNQRKHRVVMTRDPVTNGIKGWKLVRVA